MVAAIYQGYIKDEAGNIIEGASVEVRDQDTNALVDLWSNRATTSTKTNPTTTDANGYYFFYRTAGRYKITVTSASYSAVFNNVPIGTAQEYDTGSTTGLIPTVDDLATVAITGDYDDLINKPTLGTIVTYNYGTAGGEIQTNSLNDARFFRIGNNLSEGTASAMRANIQLGSGDDVTFNTVTVATIDTGQGAVECYAMDQPVRTTDTITVANASADGHALNRITADGRYMAINSNLVIVEAKGDFPSPSGGIITLAANTTYFISGTVDLTGDRLVCGANTTIIGGSSENCRIKSTGLGATALITSQYSLPMRNVTIEATLALDLSGDGSTTALDWFGVNFTDCATVGTIENYSNFIMLDSAFLNSGGLTFDGTIGTIGFSQCLFDTPTSGTALTLPATLTVSRRFRIIYSSFIVGSGETGINVNASATIPTESYILDTVNFAGGGTYITGVDETSNDALFIRCVGITNTAVNGQLYMQGNATATTVSATNTFYKVAGTTTASADNAKYDHSDNRLTCRATISRKYLIQCNLSFDSGNANVCEFGFYDSALSAIRTPSRTKATANSAGRAENVSFCCVVEHSDGDYLEIHCANTSASTNITVTDMNFVITEIK